MNAELLLLAGGAAVAGLVQGLSGFAFSMIAMSIWVWGIEPKLAAVMAVAGGLIGQLLSAFTVKRGLRAGVLMPFIAGALIGVPLGVWLLPQLDVARFRLVLGTCLLLVCPPMLLAHRLPRIRRGGRLADAAAGALGGALGGIAGFTGVVPSLWCALRGYDKDVQRNVIQNFSLTALAVTLVAYVWSGTFTADMLPKLAVVAPALVLPSLIGARIYIGLSEIAFRRVVLGVLTLAGAVMVVSGLRALL